jgi:excisionase family DNA binding protein
MPIADDRLLTVDELADYLRISRWTVYRWRSNGEGPPAVMAGHSVRYRKADVDKWLQPEARVSVAKSHGGISG